MSASLAQLWRYPIKAIGAEWLDEVDVEPDRPLPLDRSWAVLEEGRDAGDGGWQTCLNFLRGAKGPGLMAVTARVEGDVVHLWHPDRPDLSLKLAESSAAALFDWLRPIYPPERRAPAALVKSLPEGMADVSYASVSVMNMSSLRAVTQKAGCAPDPRRFRGNLWVEGWAPWEEFDRIGQKLRIGAAEFEIVEPIPRCRATEASPETGRRDMPMLQVLEQGWGHTDFGVNTRVTTGGTLRAGDEVLP